MPQPALRHQAVETPTLRAASRPAPPASRQDVERLRQEQIDLQVAKMLRALEVAISPRG